MTRAGKEVKGFEPPVNPLTTRVDSGVIVVNLGAQKLSELLKTVRSTALRTPGQIVRVLVDRELAAQKREALLNAKLIPEDHSG